MLYSEVKKQHKHFGLFYDGPPRNLDAEERDFYVEALREEIDEYDHAGSYADQYDAILDILVFAIGLMLRHGFPPEGIQEVVRANMSKIVGPLDKRGGFKLDLQKPAGWRAPDLVPYLDAADLLNWRHNV